MFPARRACHERRHFWPRSSHAQYNAGAAISAPAAAPVTVETRGADGTARYVKNAAAWLVNYERFGAKVVAQNK